jgi:precorrin-2 dehydrogenase/sirohydrochlorin ferrochelatase
LIMSWAQGGRVTLRHREYEAGDHGEAFLVIAATDQPDVNANVIREADTRGQLVNAVSEPERGSVILPAVLRRGRLVVAVSTAGASPAAAVAIRNRIDQLLAHDAEELLDFMEWFRSEAKARVSDGVLRRQLLKQLVNDDTFSKLSEADGWQSFKQEMLHQLEEAERACASSN